MVKAGSLFPALHRMEQVGGQGEQVLDVEEEPQQDGEQAVVAVPRRRREPGDDWAQAVGEVGGGDSLHC